MTTTRLRWVLLAAAAGGGALGAGLWSHPADRAVGSYVGGLALVVAAFEFGAFNIRLTIKYVPSLTMACAMATYLTTAIVLGLVLAASSPRVVSGAPMGVGLLVGMAIWLGTLLRDSWMHDLPEEPVNIRARDETIPSSRPGGQ